MMSFDAFTDRPGATRTRSLIAVNIAGLCLAMAASVASADDADFKARCSAPGVVLCKGFDSEADLQTGEVGSASDGSRQSSADTSQKASGAASLRFTFRAGNSSKNIGGFWSTDMGRSFRSGDTLHVQYRWRASPEYFSNNERYWRSSLKQINIHGPSSTCQGAEFTTIMSDDGMPTMYTNCGDGWFTDVNTNAVLAKCTGDCLLQQGSSVTPSPNGSGYNCHYWDQHKGDGKGSGCFYPDANKWITHYEVIKLGAFGGNDTVVNAFEAHDGSGYKQWHRVNSVRFNDNRDSYLSKLRLETYMTEISSSAPSAAYIWYDELIVSTQPIAAPSGAQAVAPAPPQNVSVQ